MLSNGFKRFDANDLEATAPKEPGQYLVHTTADSIVTLKWVCFNLHQPDNKREYIWLTLKGQLVPNVHVKGYKLAD